MKDTRYEVKPGTAFAAGQMIIYRWSGKPHPTQPGERELLNAFRIPEDELPALRDALGNAPLIGSDFTKGASSEPVYCGCGEPITWFQGAWLHIINPELRGTDDHDAHPGDDEPREYCDECGERSDGGEGYDGLCGNCADRAENAGRWS